MLISKQTAIFNEMCIMLYINIPKDRPKNPPLTYWYTLLRASAY